MQKWQGKIVLLDKPTYESKIKGLELSPDAQASMEADLVKHYTRLKVHAVGEDVTFCKAADEVLITPRQLSYCDTVEIDGKIKFVAQESHIIGIY
jgi:hypothetical protein